MAFPDFILIFPEISEKNFLVFGKQTFSIFDENSILVYKQNCETTKIEKCLNKFSLLNAGAFLWKTFPENKFLRCGEVFFEHDY